MKSQSPNPESQIPTHIPSPVPPKAGLVLHDGVAPQTAKLTVILKPLIDASCAQAYNAGVSSSP